jgi:hypothetical protein
LACLIRCSVHRVSLRDGCPDCGEPDPLPLSSSELACRSCNADLTRHEDGAREPESHIQAVEDAYRSALLGIGPLPALLGKTTAVEFRRFVDDMLQLLSRILSPASAVQPNVRCSPTHVARRDILTIIAQLIQNAGPSVDAQRRRSRYVQGCKLWSVLLQIIPDHEGKKLERECHRWPLALRRRYAAGLRTRTRQRWPYTPYEAANISNRFKCKVVASLSDLSARA